MIRINLIQDKGKLDLTNLGGFDLSTIKIKAVLLSLLLLYIPDFTLLPMWNSDKDKQQQVINAKNGELSALIQKVDEAKTYEQQIKELQAQEENLSQKLIAVKEAISEKKNPAALLLYIAKNTPDDLWLTELTIIGSEMTIKGEALSYPNVGDFVSNLSSSIFIGSSNIVRTGSITKEPDKRRVEEFEVKFIISRFEQ